MDLFLEIDTIALLVILVELAFLLYHMPRMRKQDKLIQDLIKRFDEHCAKLDAYMKQNTEKAAKLAKISSETQAFPSSESQKEKQSPITSRMQNMFSLVLRLASHALEY